MPSFEKRLTTLLKAKSGVLWIQTNEEYRAEGKVRSVIANLKKSRPKPYIWRASCGLFEASDPSTADQNMANPLSLMKYLYDFRKGPALVMMEDASSYLSNPQVARYMKDIGHNSQRSQPDRFVQIIIIDPKGPPTPDYTLVELDLPTREEISAMLEGMLTILPDDIKQSINNASVDKDAIIDALSGLELEQAQQACAYSLTLKRTIDLEVLIQNKKTLISGSGAIHWVDTDKRGLEGVGGLTRLKTYLQRRRKAFQRSRAGKQGRHKLPPPRGILTAGIPGTGKSLTAKAVAAAWQLPLLRFDVGAAFGKYVGESEKGLKAALKVAEAVAPCILWIDEVEKGLAGSGGGGDSDGGTTIRVFGELLTWMAENTTSVYIVATSNDPTKLPSEFFRPGRFDRIWFVDCPNKADRVDILKVLCERYEIGQEELDLHSIAENTEQFTGAELEHAIVEALWTADDDDRDLTTADVLAATEDIQPIVKGWGEMGTLKTVRDWATNAAVMANDPEETATYEGGRLFDETFG